MNSNKKEVSKTIVKSLFGLIPNIGNALDQIIYEHRARIKQNRINAFSEALKGYLETLNIENIDIEHINSEEFGDVFESILLRVANNRSQEKLEHFKHVLAMQILGKEYDDFTETFLDLITRLNEVQIIILRNLNKAKITLEPLFEKYRQTEEKLKTLKKDKEALIQKANASRIEESISSYTIQISEIELIQKGITESIRSMDYVRDPDTYTLSSGNYMFFIQDLVSKSLLVDTGIGKFDYVPYKLVEISEFGIKFLTFIENR